jgi:ADP-ribose pyrophosphatase YjhB (NUDIX family)
MPDKLFIAMKALVVHDGKVLLLRESGLYEEGTARDCYVVPGGRVQPGEKYDEALLREVYEETGLRVKIIRPVAVSEWRPEVKGEKWQIIGVFFECHPESNEVSLDKDHSSYLWINPKEYTSHPIVESLKPVFAKYLNHTTSAL